MVHLLNLGETLALAYSDARVEFRSAKTLNLIPNDEELPKVSGLAELGFTFPSTKSCKPLHGIQTHGKPCS